MTSPGDSVNECNICPTHQLLIIRVHRDVGEIGRRGDLRYGTRVRGPFPRDLEGKDRCMWEMGLGKCVLFRSVCFGSLGMRMRIIRVGEGRIGSSGKQRKGRKGGD